MCSIFKAGSYSRLKDFVHLSTLGVRVNTKEKKTSGQKPGRVRSRPRLPQVRHERDFVGTYDVRRKLMTSDVNLRRPERADTRTVTSFRPERDISDIGQPPTNRFGAEVPDCRRSGTDVPDHPRPEAVRDCRKIP
jgi:hypothetical protein